MENGRDRIGVGELEEPAVYLACTSPSILLYAYLNIPLYTTSPLTKLTDTHLPRHDLPHLLPTHPHPAARPLPARNNLNTHTHHGNRL